jgi:hypothetical protein
MRDEERVAKVREENKRRGKRVREIEGKQNKRLGKRDKR